MGARMFSNGHSRSGAQRGIAGVGHNQAVASVGFRTAQGGRHQERKIDVRYRFLRRASI